MKSRVAALFFALAGLFSLAQGTFAQRQMETLGRGLVAIHSATSQAYLSWRYFYNDPTNIAFNVYRSSNGGAAVKINATLITNTSDYLDTNATFTVTNYWYITAVTNGIEGAPSGIWGLAANSPVRQFIPLTLQNPGPDAPYDVKFCWVGDLDGDGEYDYVCDRLSTTGGKNQYLQAYKRDGTFLWQMNMGFLSTNTANAYEPDAAAICVGDKDNVTVYDLDGDGKAEVVVRAANGTILPNGTMITTNNNTSQFLCILDGLTGAEKARANIPNPYFADGPLNCHAGILYLDGVHPSIIFSGENRVGSAQFQRLCIAWDYRNGQLTQRWLYQTPNGHNDSEGHQLRIADSQHDGKDDVIRIGGVIGDSNGVPVTLYSTECVHGDRYHVTDIDPDRPGLEMYSIQQLNPTLLATELQDLGSGQLFKKWYSGVITDVGRGDVLDMDPRYRGCEVFSTQPGVFDAKGTQITATGTFPSLGIWWDADNQREMLSAADGSGYNPVINKWDANTSGVGRMYSVYNDGAHTAFGGRPAFIGDIIGDWREDFVCVNTNYTELRLFVTKIPATNRIYCLMQNPMYRAQCTFKGYYQSSYVDYFLGMDMPTPIPPMVSDARLVWRGTGGNVWDENSTASWFTNNLWVSNFTATTCAPGDTVLFDLTGSNQTAVTLTGTLTPGGVTVNSPKDYTFAGSGAFTGAMKLTKAGGGKLTLSGTNSYTGPTYIAEGSLIVNGSLPNSPVTVRGGAWLDGRLGGNGSVSSPVTVNEGGGFSPGNGTNAPGTLTIANNVALNGRTYSDFDLSDDATGLVKTNDLILITGNLTATGSNTLTIRKLNASLPNGTVYPLIKYSGTFTGNLTNFSIAGLEGIPLALTNPPGQIALAFVGTRNPTTLTWNGGVGGNQWDLITSSNWFNGTAKDWFVPQDTARFDNTGATNPTVTLTGTLNCSNLVVDATSNYTFTGSGAISGSASLLKTNSGTLTINTLNNSYTGKTILAGGTLAVSELDAIGYPSPLGNAPGGSTNLVFSNSPTLRITGESYTDRGMTLNAGTNTIEVANAADQVTVAGVIAGSGVLVKAGPGNLALNVNNSYTNQTYVLGGNLSMGGGTANQYGMGPGPGGNGNTTVTLSNATLTMFSDSASYDTCYWNVVVPTNASGTIYADDRVNLYGTLTGGGTLYFNVYYVRTELDGNWSGFTGQLNLGSDSTGGDFRIGNSFGYANASVDLADHIFAYHITAGAAVSFGSLSGGTLANMSGTAWTVGAKNLDSTFAGSITGNSLTKVGTGTLTLTGNTNTYTGVTTVSGGTLQIGSGGTGGTIGSGAITDNATLIFNRSDAINDTGFGVISGSGALTKRGAGSLTLSKAHTYSGTTAIDAGILALTNTGSLASSAGIVIQAGAQLDVSGRTGGSLTLASGKQLSGLGSVKGAFILASGAKLAPGTNSLGTLTFSNSLTLSAGCTNYLELRRIASPTNDVVKVFGALTNGGTLIVSNILGAPASGDAFKLFDAASYAGSFSSVTLPALTNGLAWNTNTLNSNGTLTVVTVTVPKVGALSFNGGNFTFSGSNGVPGLTYYIIASTNLSLPKSSWTRLATNAFDGAGNFASTNVLDTNTLLKFYSVLVP